MSNLNIYDIRCEYKENPIGIDIENPRFQWKIDSEARAVRQKSFKIQVSEDRDFRDLVWDEEQSSNQSTNIEYQGENLKSRTRYYYRIKVETNKGFSDWSQREFFEMGILNSSDWQAKWISPDYDYAPDKYRPASLLRKEFNLKEKVKKARVYITALGLYELRINGKKVGKNYLTPGWTSYNKCVQYQTYDLSDYISKGPNAVGLQIGDGWYLGDLMWKDSRNFYGKERLALVEIQVEYESGNEIIISDSSWKTEKSPILMSEIYHGEKYDARLEKEGWDQPKFNDSDWYSVKEADKSKDILIAQENNPVRKMLEIEPEEIITTPAGEKVIDMGQNMVGWLQFKVSGKSGDRVILKHAEVLDKKGNFYTDNLRSADQKIEYILNGKDEESFEPHFTFQGFRYVKIVDYPGEINLDDFKGIVLYSDMKQTIDFECSNEMLNKLHDNIIWGQRGNFVDIPTDCPQRDERLGWTGDAQVFIKTAAYNMDVSSFFTKWLHDLKADQAEDGAVPFVIPDPKANETAEIPETERVEQKTASSAWGDAACICPWTLYEIYGDKRILTEQYQSMKDWVEYIRAQGENEYLWETGFHFGDWLALDAPENSNIGLTAKEYIATAFFAYSTRILRDTAEILDRDDDYKKYNELLEKITEKFNQEFVTPNGRLSESTQTAYVLALHFDLLKEKDRKKAAAILADYVAERDGHLTTGFVGTPYLNHVLSDNGYLELAYELLEREEYPSWLYPITKGATTIWEHWDGIKEDGSFWSGTLMNSFNHYAYGAVADWIYGVVGGIKSDIENSGFKRFTIAPRPGGSLKSAKTSFDSIYGMIVSKWEIINNQFELEVEIPANTEAEVILENIDPKSVKESNKDISKDIVGIKKEKELDDQLILKVKSGKYKFNCKLKETEI